MFNNMKFKTKLIGGYAIVLTMMVIVTVVVYTSVSSLIQTQGWVEHTHQVLETSRSLSKSMVDMETGQRGFMLTGNDNFLAPFNAGDIAFEKFIVKAKELVSDNPAQVNRFDEVQKLKKEWMTNAGQFEIDLKRKVDSGELPVEALKNVLEGKQIDGSSHSAGHRAGKDMMDEQRVLLETIEGIERELMNARSLDAVNTADATQLISLWGTILAVLIGVFLVVVIVKNVMTLLGGEPADVLEIVKKVALGDLSSSSNNSENMHGILKEIGSMVASLKEKADVAELIGNGDFSADIKVASEADELSKSMIQMKENINKMSVEVNSLVVAGKEGNLDTRGDISQLKGGYREIVQGINDILDAILEPVNESSKVVEIMATGDLTVRVTGDYKGGHQLMKNSINSFADSVGGLIKQLSEAVEATASASTQISSSAEEMAAGAQEQSAQTSEVAAAMEEMSRTIVETANNATLSAEASQEASNKANEGSTKLEGSKQGMQLIVSSTDTVGNNITSLASKSEQIGEIAQVIDDIADQTNLLALNAAIEAARAGEHGRGFAVVADEVRKLAENTTKATQEIANTIRAIQTEAKDATKSMDEAGEAVKNGLKLNDEVGEVLSEILSSVDSVTGQISQVAAASEEQSATAEQVSSNVEAINNVANESATVVQQIASASEDLNRLTENLSGLVAQFKVDNGNTQNYSVGHKGNLLSQ